MCTLAGPCAGAIRPPADSVDSCPPVMAMQPKAVMSALTVDVNSCICTALHVSDHVPAKLRVEPRHLRGSHLLALKALQSLACSLQPLHAAAALCRHMPEASLAAAASQERARERRPPADRCGHWLALWRLQRALRLALEPACSQSLQSAGRTGGTFVRFLTARRLTGELYSWPGIKSCCVSRKMRSLARRSSQAHTGKLSEAFSMQHQQHWQMSHLLALRLPWWQNLQFHAAA